MDIENPLCAQVWQEAAQYKLASYFFNSCLTISHNMYT
jgi:hypothetical protein